MVHFQALRTSFNILTSNLANNQEICYNIYIIAGGESMPDRDSLYTELFDLYNQSLINFCVSQGVRSENIEDIVSEAFTRALAKSDQVMPLKPEQQRAWLYSAVVRIIKENNAQKNPELFSEIENIENYIKDDDDLERYQSEETYQGYVQQVYDELSIEKERELFKLIFNQKIDYDTLSKKYDASSGTVRVMVTRLRKKLRVIVNKILSD